MDVTQANKALGAKLRGLRAEKDWSREELYQASGVPVITIRRIEDGARPAQVPTLIALCQALGLTVGDFLNTVQAEFDKLGGTNSGKPGSSQDLTGIESDLPSQ